MANLLKKFFVFSIFIFFTNSSFDSESKKNDERYLSILKTSDFDSAITSGTSLKIIFVEKKHILIYYQNIGPQSGHLSNRLIIFVNNKYQHDYDAGTCYRFKIKYNYLKCQSDYRPPDLYSVSLDDIFAGKRIFLGGELVQPWHGARQILQ